MTQRTLLKHELGKELFGNRSCVNQFLKSTSIPIGLLWNQGNGDVPAGVTVVALAGAGGPVVMDERRLVWSGVS